MGTIGTDAQQHLPGLRDQDPLTLSGRSRLWNALLSFGEDPGDTPERRERKRIFVAATWASMPATTLLAAEFARQDAPLAAATLVAATLTLITWLLVIRRWPGSFNVTVQVVLLSTNLGPLVPALLFGGLLASGIPMVWGLIGVIGSMILFGPRVARYWLAALVCSVIVSIVVPEWVSGRYTLENPQLLATANLLIVTGIVFVTLEYFVRQRDRFQRESDDLLRNILPDDIAEQLKHDSSMIAERFDSASVLFADVVDFTPMSASMTPEELVSLLDGVFSDFDQLVEHYGLEKIKTIGDCYMVASGVPASRPDHALALAELALDIRDLVATHQYGGHQLRFRIGIASGPLVAGIIGRKKFVYDLWGDTVNTASRMESNGTAGLIQITRETHELIAGHFRCEPRGTIEVKGKGPLPVWYLHDRKPTPAPVG